MNRTGTVLKFPSGKKPTSSSSEGAELLSSQPDATVLDMTERRDAILVEERRRVKRTILTEFIGATVVVPARGLEKVTLHDISDGGLAFDMPMASGFFRVGDEVAFRLYMNHKTYFAFFVRVSNVREFPEEGVYRHGCKLVEGSLNEEALGHFVRFIETVSASLRTDSGDVLVSNIR